jgi:hypothetical protein
VERFEIPGVMSRFVRQLLFASLIACHAAVTLCGPCLHELPGSPHEMGAASRPDRAGDPIPSGRDSTDRCLICHFVAQGQLPVELSCTFSIQLLDELAIPTSPVWLPHSNPLPSHPRAPPSPSGLR